MSDLISVIIPTRDRPAELRRAVASVLAQTHRELELVVIDDGSRVPAAEALGGIDDPRLSVRRQEFSTGAPAARNAGIREARGTWVALLDDDDEYLPEALEKLLAKMKSSPDAVGVVHGGMRLVDVSGRVLEERRPRLRGDIRSALLRGEKDSNVMGLVRRSCFERAGYFDESLLCCQDWDLWLRFSAFYQTEYIVDIIAVYHCHPGQLSRALETLIRGRERMVAKHHEVFVREKVLAIHLKRLGKLHALNGTWRQSWRWFRAAVAFDPWEWPRVIAWLVLQYPFVRIFSRDRDFRRGSV